MLKYFVWAGGIVLIVAAGIFVWKTLPSSSKPVGQVPATSQQAATSTYATTTFSLVYPRELTADESYVYDKVNPKKPIYGVKFAVATAVATGTNLASDTYLSVEQLPRAKNCTGDIYLAANVKPTIVTDNGVEYSLATSSEAAVGNRYEESVYALIGSSPCTAVRYFIHYSAMENFASGAVQEFDRAALIAGFDKIRQSLVLTPVVATSTGQTP